MALCEVLPQYFPGQSEENHRKPQSRQQDSGPRSEPAASQIECRTVTHLMIFG
jgi:hypothetical protein